MSTSTVAFDPAPRLQLKPSPVHFTVALSEEEQRLFFPDGWPFHGSRVIHTSIGMSRDLWSDLLREQQPEVLVTSWATPQIPEKLLDAELSGLRYVCHTAGSVRHLVPRRFIERGGVVTNWGGLVGQFVAEHALLLILASLRRISEWPEVIGHKKPWHPSPIRARSLFGRQVGIHGFGNIARSIVSLLRPFGVHVVAYSEGVPESLFEDHRVTRVPSLEALFDKSEIIIECEALTPQTRGSVTRQLLERLPENALFVNVGRGAVVDEAALAELAGKGRLRIALDVYTTDPISLDSPLHQVSGAILSPHIAGPTNEQCPACGAHALSNLEAYLKGEPLDGIVTLAIYDRAT